MELGTFIPAMVNRWRIGDGNQSCSGRCDESRDQDVVVAVKNRGLLYMRAVTMAEIFLMSNI